MSFCASSIEDGVVPLVGTWIETLFEYELSTPIDCRSPRGNVD